MIHTAQALVDVVVEVPALPRRGGNVMAPPPKEYAGGAVNILLAAARQGAECMHAGATGTGPHGELIRAALKAEGVTVSSPTVPDLDTGICVVMLEPTAERTFVTTQAAERLISVESLQTSEPVAGDLVCVSGYSLTGTTRDPLLEWLAGLPEGVEVVLDPGAIFAELDDDIRERMLAMTTVWTGNAEESEALTGEADIVVAVAKCVEHLPPGAVAIVRDGPEGCAVHADGETTDLDGYPQKPVDTNGAGDTHTGVLVACRAGGLSWVEAARRANAGGAIKVTRRGPATAPRADEIDAFLARQSVDSR
ncbi:sugar kinase [Knoellia sinensis KCTC 19936]|uniref:Sugar kinase n=1 Tax=Knoellia sinensis KCTC 19936 TaxID=1385520 RepID=A0A0A0J468_9MICO|nr:sugar kinase [Knoellia sinensis KCTC 19936]